MYKYILQRELLYISNYIYRNVSNIIDSQQLCRPSDLREFQVP